MRIRCYLSEADTQPVFLDLPEEEVNESEVFLRKLGVLESELKNISIEIRFFSGGIAHLGGYQGSSEGNCHHFLLNDWLLAICAIDCCDGVIRSLLGEVFLNFRHRREGGRFLTDNQGLSVADRTSDQKEQDKKFCLNIWTDAARNIQQLNIGESIFAYIHKNFTKEQFFVLFPTARELKAFYDRDHVK